MARGEINQVSTCAVQRGEVDLSYYAERDGEWRALKISAPARRALINANVYTLADLREHDLRSIARLHGMGPKALSVLERALQATD